MSWFGFKLGTWWSTWWDGVSSGPTGDPSTYDLSRSGVDLKVQISRGIDIYVEMEG